MIDIERLSEAELIALHNRIVDRLRELQQQRVQQGMTQVSPWRCGELHDERR
ncbi:Uncharacterised protein [Klebsiella pneumoniae subsp. ozaenae]|uniref:Uncharacterized protein n=1 Tax=Klebsiella pneumoniae subsp. ozaenae TaxID=574 RepID=A0A378AUF1_KLEPO|nr:Uncharacterised protein [Klebsiella pneumoniae subsp. ozaenae]